MSVCRSGVDLGFPEFEALLMQSAADASNPDASNQTILRGENFLVTIFPSCCQDRMDGVGIEH